MLCPPLDLLLLKFHIQMSPRTSFSARKATWLAFGLIALNVFSTSAETTTVPEPIAAQPSTYNTPGSQPHLSFDSVKQAQDVRGLGNSQEGVTETQGVS